MDYLDPRKQARHRIILFTGYMLITVAIVIAALVLLYEAFGFGVTKNGTVIQNGLVFVSSHPNPADIYIDGKHNANRTNTRLVLPSNNYHIELKRAGYRNWERMIEVNGGSVLHFDYPLLFPVHLITTKAKTYESKPAIATQSPDKRWLIVQQPGSMTNFELYDTRAPIDQPTILSLPATILTAATSAEHWEFVEWADDNQHVLMKHVYDSTSEYVLIDRAAPASSLNLAFTLLINPPQMTLQNKKYDRYIAYDPTTQLLQTTSLKTPAPVLVLEHVLSYKIYHADTILYVTDTNAAPGKVNLMLQVGTKAYAIRTFSSNGNYLQDVTEYNGTLYIAAGNANENKLYVYRDPIAQLTTYLGATIGPVEVMRVNHPSRLEFSPTAQFIVAESGSQFSVYDTQNTRGYNYNVLASLDAPQTHATWMDGDRLTYVSGGKLIVFDYDHSNQQTLMNADAVFTPFFTANYHSVIVFAPGVVATQTSITQTSLLNTP